MFLLYILDNCIVRNKYKRFGKNFALSVICIFRELLEVIGF